MQVFSSPTEYRRGTRPVCAAIGVFDGLHLGHQAVLGRARADAEAVVGLVLSVTFDRHPNQVVAPHRTPPAIYPQKQKLQVLASLGVDMTWLIRFDASFSQVPAEDFIRRFARDFAPLHSLSVGAGFTFGHRRSGDLALLKRLGEELGFEVRGLPAVESHGQVVSSTRIREAIGAGHIETASALLGRPYSIMGPVVSGDGLGHQLGIPTANLELGNLVLPPDGVYVAQVRLKDKGVVYPAVLNLGFRPTVQAAHPQRRCEVHLLDFEGDLYGAEVEVIIGQRLRAERKFPSLADLQRQIHHDVAMARNILQQPSSAN